MLNAITHIVSLMAMSISLWMAFYLFARGFPNRITLRAVLALLAIAIFFLGTYNDFYEPAATNRTGLGAALLVIALVSWYSASFALRSPEKQIEYRWMEAGIYILGIISVLSLITAGSEALPQRDDVLYTARLEGNFVNLFYGATQIITSAGILFNLTARQRIRRTDEGRLFIFASFFLMLAIAYGILSLSFPMRFPRVIEDGLVFGGIFLLGISVARHQSLVERRTIWQDFPIAMLGMTGIVVLYLAVCSWLQVPDHLLGNIAALVITTHCMYDLGREAVERRRKIEEQHFRRISLAAQKLRDEALRSYLNEELTLLLKTLDSAAGVIAARQNDKLVVAASSESVLINSELPELPSYDEGIFHVEGQIAGISWASQVLEGMEAIALVGIGLPNKKVAYSAGDLELLNEFTEQIGTLISINRLHQDGELPSTNLELLPKEDWVTMVDAGLRHYTDYVFLGQSPLAEWVGVSGDSHIERGKQTQMILHEAIQSLRPEGERPPEPLPREWYNHVVLYDAYVKSVPNREVAARLYVSEGTFHRIRRHALRGVTRYLAEKKRIT